jgi:hypothetical protein
MLQRLLDIDITANGFAIGLIVVLSAILLVRLVIRIAVWKYYRDQKAEELSKK